MRIVLMMVTRNEAGRYLQAVLDWNRQFVDEICVYDDCSDDETRAVALGAGCHVQERDTSVPPFLRHEGRFREAAWRWMERTVEPVTGDWVLCLDADEFLVHGDGTAGVRGAIEWAESQGFDGLICDVPEIVAAAGDTLYRRVDGFWPTIQGVRLVKWKPDADFADKVMASGSVPSNLTAQAAAENMSILHVGYLRVEDAAEKHARYSALPGHNPAHVRSILEPGRVEVWEGPTPFALSVERDIDN